MLSTIIRKKMQKIERRSRIVVRDLITISLWLLLEKRTLDTNST